MAIGEIKDDVEVDADPGISESALEMAKGHEASRVLMRNLIPGTEASDIRRKVNNSLTEDLLGQNWRRDDRSWEQLEAEAREKARMRIGHALDSEQQELRRLYARELLSVAALSDRQREICRLRYEHDLTYQQIGEQLGISPDTVGVHLHRSQEKLRKAAS